MEFGKQDRDEGGVVPFEICVCEDVRGDYADWVCGFGGHARFVDPLRNYGFGEDVEEVEEKGWAGAGWGRVGREGEEEGRDGDAGAGDGEGLFEDAEDVGEL